mmetsp:Transcript_39482/g.85972  ORF Transcript_39482/g.85972 Transcript_39482/m.85972 type:complete len:381 (+) Transcript_39482:336-1478(+)
MLTRRLAQSGLGAEARFGQRRRHAGRDSGGGQAQRPPRGEQAGPRPPDQWQLSSTRSQPQGQHEARSHGSLVPVPRLPALHAKRRQPRSTCEQRRGRGALAAGSTATTGARLHAGRDAGARQLRLRLRGPAPELRPARGGEGDVHRPLLRDESGPVLQAREPDAGAPDVRAAGAPAHRPLPRPRVRHRLRARARRAGRPRARLPLPGVLQRRQPGGAAPDLRPPGHAAAAEVRGAARRGPLLPAPPDAARGPPRSQVRQPPPHAGRRREDLGLRVLAVAHERGPRGAGRAVRRGLRLLDGAGAPPGAQRPDHRGGRLVPGVLRAGDGERQGAVVREGLRQHPPRLPRDRGERRAPRVPRSARRGSCCRGVHHGLLAAQPS